MESTVKANLIAFAFACAIALSAAACSQPAEQDAAAPAETAEVTGPPVQLTATPLGGNAAAETGALTINTAAGDLASAQSMHITTEQGASYDLSFLSEPDINENLGSTTWNSLVNPSNGQEVRLFAVSNASNRAQGFCRPGGVTHIALGQRVEGGTTELRIAAFDDNAAPSAESPQSACSSYSYSVQ